MRLIGTVSNERNQAGLLLLRTHNTMIPVRGVTPSFYNSRVCVVGNPRWSSGKGSFFEASKCWSTNKPDKNSVVVEGTIIKIYPEHVNRRNRRSVSILLRQSRVGYSTVLVTALSANVDMLNTSNLSIGMRIRIGGYIAFHGEGLHILYMKTLSKEGGSV